MNTKYAYAHGALVKLAEHQVEPETFVNAAIATQDPGSLKIASAIVEYAQALEKQALSAGQIGGLAAAGGLGGGLAGGVGGGLVGGPPGAVIGGGLGAPAGAVALPAAVAAGMAGRDWMNRRGMTQAADAMSDLAWAPAASAPPGIAGLLPAGGAGGMETFENIGPDMPGLDASLGRARGAVGRAADTAGDAVRGAAGQVNLQNAGTLADTLNPRNVASGMLGSAGEMLDDVDALKRLKSLRGLV